MFGSKDKEETTDSKTTSTRAISAPRTTTEETPKKENKSASIFVVHQNIQGTNTTSVYGTYTDKETAQRAVDQVRGSGMGLTAHKEAKYFIQEVEAEEVSREVQAGPGRPASDSNMVFGATPVAGITTTEEGDSLNVPNKQLKSDEDDPHTRGLKQTVQQANRAKEEQAKEEQTSRSRKH